MKDTLIIYLRDDGRMYKNNYFENQKQKKCRRNAEIQIKLKSNHLQST